MKNIKKNLIVCCAAILCIMVIAVGCTPKEPTKIQEPTAKPTEEATAQPTAEATQEPEAESTQEATKGQETEVTYSDEEVAVAKKVVEDYLKAQNIDAESVEAVTEGNLELEMKFTVKIKDQEQAKEVIAVRDADGKWAVMPEETTED